MQRLLIGLTIFWVSGCATTSQQVAPADGSRSVSHIELEPIHLRAIAGPDGTIVVAEDAQALFDGAGQALSERRYRAALAQYDRMLAGYPESRLVQAALYNAGLSHEGLGEYDRAAARYRALIERAGQAREALDASFRLGACHAEIGNWAASAAVYAEILARDDITAADRIEASARRGFAQFRLGDHDASERTLRDGLHFYRRVRLLDQLDTDFYLAMLNYYYAALPHLAYREVEVTAGDAMGDELDHKARLLLVAQGRYIDAIHVKNAYWATAAGFQIGSLYREFYSLLMTTLPSFKVQARENAAEAGIAPDKAEQQLVRIYLEEVHDRIKPLLGKALRVFEKTVRVGERIGLESGWVGKSRYQAETLRELISLTPEEAVARVPDVLPEDEGEAPPSLIPQ